MLPNFVDTVFDEHWEHFRRRDPSNDALRVGPEVVGWCEVETSEMLTNKGKAVDAQHNAHEFQTG